MPSNALSLIRAATEPVDETRVNMLQASIEVRVSMFEKSNRSRSRRIPGTSIWLYSEPVATAGLVQFQIIYRNGRFQDLFLVARIREPNKLILLHSPESSVNDVDTELASVKLAPVLIGKSWPTLCRATLHLLKTAYPYADVL